MVSPETLRQNINGVEKGFSTDINLLEKERQEYVRLRSIVGGIMPDKELEQKCLLDVLTYRDALSKSEDRSLIEPFPLKFYKDQDPDIFKRLSSQIMLIRGATAIPAQELLSIQRRAAGSVGVNGEFKISEALGRTT